MFLNITLKTGPQNIYTGENRWLATPKRWRFVRGHDKPIHGSCAIYFPGGISKHMDVSKNRGKTTKMDGENFMENPIKMNDYPKMDGL